MVSGWSLAITTRKFEKGRFTWHLILWCIVSEWETSKYNIHIFYIFILIWQNHQFKFSLIGLECLSRDQILEDWNSENICVWMCNVWHVPPHNTVTSVSMVPVLALLLLAGHLQAQAVTLESGSPGSVARERIVRNINRYRRGIAKKKGPNDLPGASNMMEVVNIMIPLYWGGRGIVKFMMIKDVKPFSRSMMLLWKRKPKLGLTYVMYQRVILTR